MHHARIPSLALVALASALTGCSSTHESLTATSGVYELSIAGEHDACSPSRTTGPMGTAGLVSTSGAITVSVPDLAPSRLMLVTLSDTSSYSQERTETLASCSSASLVRSYSVVSAGAGGVVIAYSETWRGLSSCTPAMRAMMPSAPSVDCRADLVMHYRLSTPCAAPCRLEVNLDASVSCSC